MDNTPLREDILIEQFLQLTGSMSEDASWIDIDGEKIVVNVDAFDSELHWLNVLSYRQAGMRAVVSSISDILVKGADPIGILVSLRIPSSLESKKVVDFFEGIKHGAMIFGAKILGGDTDIVHDNVFRASIVSIGVTRDGFLITRNGAKTGDYLLITGDVGCSSMIYDFQRGEIRSKMEIPRLLKLNIPHKDNWLSVKNFVNSAIDNSDGLALSIHYLSESSNVGIVLEKVPICKYLLEEYDFRTALEKALYWSGEEYNFIFTVSGEHVDRVLSTIDNADVIGRVVETRGVFLKDYGKVDKRGWIGGLKSCNT